MGLHINDRGGQGRYRDHCAITGGLGSGAVQGVRDHHSIDACVRQGHGVEAEAGGVSTDVGGAPLPLVAEDAAIGAAGRHGEGGAAAFKNRGGWRGLHTDAGGCGSWIDRQHARIAGRGGGLAIKSVGHHHGVAASVRQGNGGESEAG